MSGSVRTLPEVGDIVTLLLEDSQLKEVWKPDLFTGQMSLVKHPQLTAEEQETALYRVLACHNPYPEGPFSEGPFYELRCFPRVNAWPQHRLAFEHKPQNPKYLEQTDPIFINVPRKYLSIKWRKDDKFFVGQDIWLRHRKRFVEGKFSVERYASAKACIFKALEVDPPEWPDVAYRLHDDRGGLYRWDLTTDDRLLYLE